MAEDCDGAFVRRLHVVAVREWPNRPGEVDLELAATMAPHPGGSVRQSVTRSEWPLDWPPRLGDIVTVAVPRVVAAERPEVA